MRNSIKLLICLLCVVLFICGCTEDIDTESLPAERSDEVSVSVPEQSAEENSDDVSEEQSTLPEGRELFDGAAVQEVEIDGGVFLVKQIKKQFNGDDLVLLYIKNLTNNDYSVTIDGSYLDENGNVLLTESQTFIQYYAGYENYFLFRPETAFDDFSYTLSFDEAKRLTYVEYDGSIQEIRADDVLFEFGYINDDWDVHIHPFAVEKQDNNRYPTISAYTSTIVNDPGYARQIFMHWVLYNGEGEIIAIFSKAHIPSYGVQLGERFSAFPIYQTVKDELVWPEMFLGEIKGIGCVHEVDRYPNEFEHNYEMYNYHLNYEKETIFDFEK